MIFRATLNLQLARMVWQKPQILEQLRKLHDAGKDISYNGLAARKQPLVSAAAYHFGSYRKAVEKAGIDYAKISRRPRWTKPMIIALIKARKRRGGELHWSAVTRGRNDLAKAAFASLQERLFGSWDRALHAAGLDANDVNLYRKWNRDTILFELKCRDQDRAPLNSGAIQREDPGLHAAAIRYFKSYDAALYAAGLDPEEVRERRSWTESDVIAELRRMPHDENEQALRRTHPALYSAATRIFGTFADARAAARGPKRRRKKD